MVSSGVVKISCIFAIYTQIRGNKNERKIIDLSHPPLGIVAPNLMMHFFHAYVSVRVCACACVCMHIFNVFLQTNWTLNRPTNVYIHIGAILLGAHIVNSLHL